MTRVEAIGKLATTSRDEADLIPDWAAIAVLLGAILAIVGFVAVHVTLAVIVPRSLLAMIRGR